MPPSACVNTPRIAHSSIFNTSNAGGQNSEDITLSTDYYGRDMRLMVAQMRGMEGDSCGAALTGVTVVGLISAAPSGIYHAMIFRVTSMLPRVALEYGHTMCAASTQFWLLQIHAFNVNVQFGFDTKTGWQWTNAHFTFNEGLAARKFVARSHKFHRPQETGKAE